MAPHNLQGEERTFFAKYGLCCKNAPKMAILFNVLCAQKVAMEWKKVPAKYHPLTSKCFTYFCNFTIFSAEQNVTDSLITIQRKYLF